MTRTQALIGLTLAIVAVIGCILWYIARARKVSGWVLAILAVILFILVAYGQGIRRFSDWQ
jgi:nicotinamide riboside transporter PnuC